MNFDQLVKNFKEHGGQIQVLKARKPRADEITFPVWRMKGGAYNLGHKSFILRNQFNLAKARY
jgi:hypothetical protein